VNEDPEDPIALGVSLHAGSGGLHGAGEVPAEGDRKLVVEHSPEHPGRDRVVDPDSPASVSFRG
jgi:hypothetical protein